MTQSFSHGDSVTVETPTINDGEPFEGTVVSVDRSTETVSVEPEALDVVELAIVGLSEVESNRNN